MAKSMPEFENEIDLLVAAALAKRERAGGPLQYGWVETVTAAAVAEYKATHTPEQYDLELFRSKHFAAIGAADSAALERRIFLRVLGTLYPRADHFQLRQSEQKRGNV